MTLPQNIEKLVTMIQTDREVQQRYFEGIERALNSLALGDSAMAQAELLNTLKAANRIMERLEGA